MAKKYLVGIGGESLDTYDEYEDYNDAVVACSELAVEKAFNEGLDLSDIGFYEHDPDNIGYCPFGNDGAYWPVVKEVNP